MFLHRHPFADIRRAAFKLHAIGFASHEKPHYVVIDESQLC
jgi:hypothetical protein